MQKAPNASPRTLFSPIFSHAREKIGPPEARQKRPRRNEALQARLLILCARFFLSKPQTKFAVWVFLCKSAATSQSAFGCQHPYPFCPFGTFPPDRGNRPLEGEPLGGRYPRSLWRKNQIWKGMETRKVRKSAAGWLMATPERPSSPGSSRMSGTYKSPLRQEASSVAA